MQKFLFKLYDMGWRLIIPLLKLNRRLNEGYAARTLMVAPKGPVSIWIQAASAGEAYLAVSLINALPADGKFEILVSTNTRQGMEILEKAAAGINRQMPLLNIRLTFFPFDQPALMDSAVRRFDPKVMVLLETELWPGLLSALQKHGCKILIINARITQKSLNRYRMIPRLWKRLAPDRVLAITRADADRFAKLFGHENVEIMSNIKFDRVNLEDSSNTGTDRLYQLLPHKTDFLVLGSIRQQEESDVIKIIEKLSNRFPNLVIGIFPRHMHRLTAWERYLDKIKKPWTYRSALSTEAVYPGTLVLWDTFGELNSAYANATAVFVGGSLAPLGGQNFLEPLINGVIPVIGPSWENFTWVGKDVFTMGLVRKCRDWELAVAELTDLIENPPPKNRIQDTAAEYVKKRRGGTDQACRLIMQTLIHNQTEQ